MAQAITNARVAELKAVVDALESQKRDLEVQIRSAYGEFIAAEREFNRNEKPTPAMLKALALMSQGYVLTEQTFAPYGYSLSDGGRRETVRQSVFLGLLSREAITEGERGVLTRDYSITEHGRSIAGVNAESEAANPVC